MQRNVEKNYSHNQPVKPEIVLQKIYFPLIIPRRYFKQQPDVLQGPRIPRCNMTLYAEGARRKTESVHNRCVHLGCSRYGGLRLEGDGHRCGYSQG